MSRGPSAKFALFGLLLLSAACRKTPAPLTSPGANPALTLFAAASTTEVIREAGRRYQADAGVSVVFSFDSSSNLAKQIKEGAPADIFVSADRMWMDEIEQAGHVVGGTREDLLANRLALIAPKGKAFDVELSSSFSFTERLPRVKRISVGDPAHVPAGRYARQALQALGWWEDVSPLLVPSQDVRAALRLVELGEVDAGIVYATDVRASEHVVVVAWFQPELHGPVRYTVACCRESVAARDFIRFLRSPEMIRVFEAAGFQVVPPAAASEGG